MNTYIICLSLKYLNKNHKSICKVSKWICFELEKYNYNESKFTESLRRKDLEIIETLIKFNKNINLSYYVLDDYDSYEYLNLIKLLLKNRVDISKGDDHILIYASYSGHIDTIKLLLKNGVDIYVNDNEPLRWACNAGQLDVVKLLIDYGADIHANNDQALIWASGNNHIEVVKFLVENGADIHANDDEALRSATHIDHTDIVNFLKSLN